jgi:hypothetical protein
MKKEEVILSLDRAGHTINDLNGRVWNTALHPTQYGWASSLASVAAIPILNAASLGHMVSSAVIEQVSPSVFDKLSSFMPGSNSEDSKG